MTNLTNSFVTQNHLVESPHLSICSCDHPYHGKNVDYYGKPFILKLPFNIINKRLFDQVDFYNFINSIDLFIDLINLFIDSINLFIDLINLFNNSIDLKYLLATQLAILVLAHDQQLQFIADSYVVSQLTSQCQLVN